MAPTEHQSTTNQKQALPKGQQIQQQAQTENQEHQHNAHTFAKSHDEQEDHNGHDDVLVNGDSVQFEYNDQTVNSTSSKKKKKKKKKAKQAKQNVIGQDINLDDPDFEYPDSRILKQDANGDVIVQPLNPSTVTPIPVSSMPNSTSNTANNNSTTAAISNNTRRRSSANRNDKSFIPQDPAVLNDELKNYWLSLSIEEKKQLLNLERDSVFKIMKDQQRITCNCSVCGRKREIIEQELKKLYDDYSDSIENQESITNSLFDSATPSNIHHENHNHSHSHNHQHDSSSDHHSHSHSHEYNHTQSRNNTPPPPQQQQQQQQQLQPHPDPDPDPQQQQQQQQSQSQLKQSTNQHPNQKQPNSDDPIFKERNGLMSVAEDLLQNDGKKFLEMMEKLAESRIQRGQKQNSSNNSSNNLINNNQIEEEENSNYLNHGEDDDFDDNDYVLKDAITADDVASRQNIPSNMIIPQKVPVEVLCNEPNYVEEEDPDYVLAESEEDEDEEEEDEGEEDEQEEEEDDEGDEPLDDDGMKELLEDIEGLKEDLTKPTGSLAPNYLSEFQSKIERAVEILASDDFKLDEAFLNENHDILNGKLHQEFDPEENEDFEDVFEDEEDKENGHNHQDGGLFNATMRNTLIKRIEELSDGEYEVEQEGDNGEPLFEENDNEPEGYNHENELEEDEDEDEEDEDEDDEGEEDDDEYEEEEEDDGDYIDDENEAEQEASDAIDEKQQLEEGRAMLQLCTAKMLRQSLLESYKKKKHEEYLESFLMELEDESEKQKSIREKKQKEKEKKKEKKRLLMEQRERERLAKLEEQERLRREKEEENRRKLEAGRKKKQEEERKRAEEKRLREEQMERNRKAKEEKRRAAEEAKRLAEETKRLKEEEERKAREEEAERIAQEKRLKEEEERRILVDARKVEEQRLREIRRKEELINKSPFIQQKNPVVTAAPIYQNGVGSNSSFTTPFSNPIATPTVPSTTQYQQPRAQSHSQPFFSNSSNFFSQRPSEGSIPGVGSPWMNDPSLNTVSNAIPNPLSHLNNVNGGAIGASIFNNLDMFAAGGLPRQMTPETVPSSAHNNNITTTPIDMIANGLSNTHFDASSQSSSYAPNPPPAPVDSLDPFSSTSGLFGSSNLWTQNNGFNTWSTTNSNSLWGTSGPVNMNRMNGQAPPTSSSSGQAPPGPPPGVLSQSQMFPPAQPSPQRAPLSSTHSIPTSESKLADLVRTYQLAIYKTYLKWPHYHTNTNGFITLDELHKLFIADNAMYSSVNAALFRSILESQQGVLSCEIINDPTGSATNSFVRINQKAPSQVQVNSSSAVTNGFGAQNSSTTSPFQTQSPSQSHLQSSQNLPVFNSTNTALKPELSESRSNSIGFNPWGTAGL